MADPLSSGSPAKGKSIIEHTVLPNETLRSLGSGDNWIIVIHLSITSGQPRLIVIWSSTESPFLQTPPSVTFNTTTANLAQLNHITSNAYIFPGMVLKVPDIGLEITQLSTGQSKKQLTSNRTSLSDILGLSFETSKLSTTGKSAETTNGSGRRVSSEGGSSNLQNAKTAKNNMYNRQPHTNEELITENAGFIKLKCVLLPTSIEGTLIVTASAIMFEPQNQAASHQHSTITPITEISWLECVRIPKTTSTTLKLEEEFPVVNSILRSFSDYFEESNDESFHFIFMKLSMDFNNSIQFQYFKLQQSDVNQLFNLLSDLNLFKYELSPPSIEKDKSYVDFQKEVKELYPGMLPNWLLLNDKVHKSLDHQHKLKKYGRRSSKTHSTASVEIDFELAPPDMSIERGRSRDLDFEQDNENDNDYIKIPKIPGPNSTSHSATSAASATSDSSIYLPELQNSENNFILGDSKTDNSLLKQLTAWLPDESAGISSWRLIFSSEKQGHSLNTLYRNCLKEKYSKSNNILIIESTTGYYFGSYLSELPRKIETHNAKKFYGSGESFLYSFYKNRRKQQEQGEENPKQTNQDRHHKYSWQQLNNFIATGDNDHFAVGGGKGKHGIWIDSRLCGGSSQPCDTFGNLESLAGERDFVISSMELWVLE